MILTDIVKIVKRIPIHDVEPFLVKSLLEAVGV